MDLYIYLLNYLSIIYLYVSMSIPYLLFRHSSIFLSEEEKSGDETVEEDELPTLPEEIQSYQVGRSSIRPVEHEH